MSQAKPSYSLKCATCGYKNVFSQPYPYHAGFSDAGFLYNEQGNATLIWCLYDPYFEKHFKMALWPVRDFATAKKMEDALPLSPRGDRWSFSAPARCATCHSPIAPPMTEGVNYLVYPDNVDLAGRDRERWLEFYIQNKGQVSS